MNGFGARLRRVMREQGWSAVSLADRLHLRRRQIYRWLSGDQLPSWETMVGLCKVTHKHSDYYLGLNNALIDANELMCEIQYADFPDETVERIEELVDKVRR